jgi:hypothetical protein
MHPKYPERVDGDLKKYIIPSLVETKWGDKSIVKATLELLKEAYKNASNKWFLLCSEDYYPLVDYEDLKEYLSKQSKSIFDVLDSATNKTSQFWALTRNDVSIIMKNESKWESILKPINPKKQAADEFFFLPLLKSIDSKYSFTDKKFCYVKWFSFLTKHPTTFGCLLESDKSAIEDNKSCFIRKTLPSFENEVCPNKNITILLVHGTDSIKDYRQFIRDFKDIANIFVLSLKDYIESEDLKNIASQIYFCIWSDVENAKKEIQTQFAGNTIVIPEKLDVNQLKAIMLDSSTSDSNGNIFETNINTNNLPMLFENVPNIELPENEVILRLGDIIIINDPSNEILNDNVFLIEYIDSNKIKLVNSETFEKTTLFISPEGVIGDGSIQSIKIISSNPNSGYARQNDLLPGKWVNIYFGGEIPTLITGKITNLEEDMIEIKTTDNDTIYINFNYQGIPEDIPIETFEIRSAIKGQYDEEEKEEEAVDKDIDQIEKEEELENEFIPLKDVKEKVQTLFDIDDLEFGNVISVEEQVNISKDKYRYNIEVQANDLLEELVSNIPNHNRTGSVLNNIHIIITRFIQLREMSSIFDDNHNVIGVVKKSADDKPLADYLASFRNTLYWVLMVAKHVKKIYPDESSTSSYTKVDDHETYNHSESMLAISEAFRSRSNRKDERQVKKFVSYGNPYVTDPHIIDPYMTPFYPINPEERKDVFNSSNGIIIEGNVESNLNAIIDNLGDLYSTVVSKSEITSRKFIMQRYNLGLSKLHADNFKGPKLIARRLKLTNNDPISISSIMTLPEPTVRFSQVNLPGSSLLVKSNLNLHFLNYWQLLKQKTKTNKIVIDGLDNELEYTDSNFVDNIKQYFLDLTEYNRPDDITNLEIYKTFLNTIIPKIRVLFSLVKKYIKGRLSLSSVVSYLEPFMIYSDDLTFMQYREMNNYLYQSIKDNNLVFNDNTASFGILRTMYEGKNVINALPLFSTSLFASMTNHSDFANKVFKPYNLNEQETNIYTQSECLKKVILSDYGNLYNTGVAISKLSLMFPSKLKSVFEKGADRLKAAIERGDDNCKVKTIAKRYYNISELEKDNGRDIYFDKEFDKTDYSLIDKYKKEFENVPNLNRENRLKLNEFLVKEFITKHGMNKSDAIITSETLINQAKIVRDGDYAILVDVDANVPASDERGMGLRNLISASDGSEIENMSMNNYERNTGNMRYFKRVDDLAQGKKWVEIDYEMDENNEQIESSYLKFEDITCDLNYDCLYNPTGKNEDDMCEPESLVKKIIAKESLKKLMDQFDDKYNISKDELQKTLEKHMEYYNNIFYRLQEIKKKDRLKYNEMQYNIGLSVKEEMRGKVVSPYIKLRDLILGQNDFVKKQANIIKFVSTFCREGDPEIPNINDGEMENEWWLYCNVTNTKLMPKFYYILADAFNKGMEFYDDAVEYLKRKIGKQSEDGDAWVDEHSGEVICLIDMDVSEGYKDGFVDKSRDIIEKDTAEVIIENQDKKNKRLSPEGQIVSNIITIMSVNMAIDVEPFRNTIIKIVTELMSDGAVLEKEPAYRKREEDAAKNNKKLPSYGSVYNSTILYLSLGLFLIAIQTSVPNIRTSRTSPGCQLSFSGFPLEGEGDDSALNYVACVAVKSRDATTIPWNVLPKNQEKIATIIKTFIIKYLLPYNDVNKMIKDKIEYLLSNNSDDIPEEHNVSKWTTFLPPLQRFHITHLQNVSEGFKDSLINDLTSASPKQLEKMLVVQSKIISFSLAIQESIQKIVEKKNLILASNGGRPFMDNACCNQANNTQTTLDYFIEEDNSIEVYNKTVSDLSNIVRDMKILTDSAIMLSEVNTKRSFPLVKDDFSEETIYHAFIYFCKFLSSVPLSEEIASMCIDKPQYLKKMDTIQEKIAKLKRDGRNYTKDQFIRLFQIVSRNNIIKMSLDVKHKSCINDVNILLNIFEETDESNVAKVLLDNMRLLVDNYEVKEEENARLVRTVKDYLYSSNERMRRGLIAFISNKGGNKLEINKNVNFLKNLSVWRFDNSTRNKDIKIYDDALYNYTNFFKNFVHMLAIVFPTMIINQTTHRLKSHKYWHLSSVHEKDIEEMGEKFYQPIEKFYGMDAVKSILKEVVVRSKSTYLLSEFTPVKTNRTEEDDRYDAFGKTMATLLHEYYLLNVLTDYIDLAKDQAMVLKALQNPSSRNDLFSADILIESQQLNYLNEEERDFVEGDISNLNKEIGNLLMAYLSIMRRCKDTINLSFDDIQDKVFKQKEAEKYDFTDKLQAMTKEERAADTMLKIFKLGPLYSLGASKGIREYDPDHFEYDKQVAERAGRLQNKALREGIANPDDMDIADIAHEEDVDNDVQQELGMMNNTDDYNDGDPYGDELENGGDYY